MSYTLNSHNTFIELGADLVRFKAEVHFDGMEIAKLNMKTMDLHKTLEVSFYSCACNIVIVIQNVTHLDLLYCLHVVA